TAGGPLTFCAGGSVLLTAPAGFAYLWSNGAATRSITANTTGSFTVQTILNGCTSAASAAVAVNAGGGAATPTITANGPLSFCTGGTVTLTASGATGGSTYLWSNGATTATISVTASGTFTLQTVNGTCTSSASTPVAISVGSAPAAPSVTASGPLTFCAGGSVTLTAPAGFSYIWSNGAATQSVTVSAAGSLSVQTVFNGCTSLSSAAVTVNVTAAPTTPAISAGGPTTVCEGGSVTLTAPAGFTYLWSTGATTRSIVASATGNYNVRTISTGCTSSVSADMAVTVNAAPTTPTISAGGPLTFCTGGSVTLSAPAGFTYLWSNGATTQAITANTAGSFTVQTVFNGCTSQPSAAVAVSVTSTPGAPGVTAGGPTTFCQGNTVTLSATTASSYLWSNGATTQAITVNASGNYSVQAVNGTCTSAASAATTVTVNPMPPLAGITVTGNTRLCPGQSVNMNAAAGYAYIWSNGENTQTITVRTAGNYTVQLISGTCTSAASLPVNVTESPAPPAAVITASGSTTFCEGNSVTLSGPAANGWLWSSGETSQSISVNTSAAITLRTISGSCTSAVSAPTNVTVNPAPTAPVVTASSPLSFCEGGSVTLTASGSGAFIWSSGESTASITVATSGSYSVRSVSNGCTSAALPATIVTVNPAPAMPIITPGGSTSFCSGGSVTLTAPAGFSYIWSTGETSASITASVNGNYTVRVVLNGCTSAVSEATTVTVTAAPAAPVITPSGPLSFCSGGSVTLSAPAGGSYIWSNNATTETITVGAAGTYTVRAINGTCTSSVSEPVTVTVGTAPAQPSITPSGPTSFCDGGSVTLTAPAGFTYLWSNGSIAQSIVADTTGNYSVMVISGSCTSAASAVTAVTSFELPATPLITQSGDTLRTTATGSLQWYFNGGTIPGATNAQHIVSQSGNYTVVVKNAQGCSAVSEERAVVYVGIPKLHPAISLSPVPALDMLNLNLADMPEGKAGIISITDMTGREVYTETMPGTGKVRNTSMNISSLPAGAYMLRMTSDKIQLMKKFTKQ
ncbi:MAG: T9SS type A sorting domain-containing protein, partial [Bacteroidota bacterium]